MHRKVKSDAKADKQRRAKRRVSKMHREIADTLADGRMVDSTGAELTFEG